MRKSPAFAEVLRSIARWNQAANLPVVATLIRPESASQRAERVAALKRLVKDVFKSAVHTLGREEAEVLFAHVSKKLPKKLGRPSSTRRPDIATLLMSNYEHRPKGETKAALTRRLHRDHPGKFGNSAEAIEKKLDRLFKKRAAERAEEKRQAMAYKPGETLVSANRGDKK